MSEANQNPGTEGNAKAAEVETRIREAGARARAEAEERRKAAENAQETAEQRPKELGGRNGPEPTRFGDWEKKGIASDF
jgi:hypothetical protein